MSATWTVTRLCLGLIVVAATRAGAVDKERMQREMLELGRELRAVKTDGSAAAGALRQRYADLSRQLGGDDPAHVLGGRDSRPASARAARTQADLALLDSSPPPACILAERLFTNTEPVHIMDADTVTSTIEVTGLRGYILEVEVLTRIEHTWAADLDITLTSPSGRVVTLTTDNGGDNDDVFNGTLWTDQAHAPVVMYAFQDQVPAIQLSPEEPLGLLSDPLESAEGTWTLTIHDDLGGDAGVLRVWGLSIRTLPWAGKTVKTVSSGAEVPIVDLTTAESTIVVPASDFQPAYLQALTLTTDIEHPFNADLDVRLTAPSGQTVTLTAHNGGAHADVFAGTEWRETANPFGQVPYLDNPGVVSDQPFADGIVATPLSPQEPFSLLRGEDPEGPWTLSILDDVVGDEGVLHSWSLSYVQIVKCMGRGDFDGDFSEDLVLRDTETNAHMLWFMQGTTRTAGNKIVPKPLGSLQAVGSDNFLGAPSADLVLRDTDSGQVGFWELEDAHFVGSASLSGTNPLPTSWILAATGDFNHDGSADLLFRERVTHELLIWTLGQDGAPTTEKTGEIVPNPSHAVDDNWQVVAALDFDHDNNRDLLWYNNTSGKIVVWFMNHLVDRTAGTFTSPASAGDNNWKVVAAGDYGPPIYGDQNYDIVWRNTTSGKFVVWHMDGGSSPPTRLAGVFTSPDSPANPLDWTIVGPR